MKAANSFIKIDRKVYYPFVRCCVVSRLPTCFFAVDSIPAIFSITKDRLPCLFFQHVIRHYGPCALMFFLLVNIIDKFHYLKVGLAALLFHRPENAVS
ncbi:hypothetical protein HK413_14305 [Mucilaginibacter sp. S1162]|uniref:Uncharacterized protein n=1 Tax=Mucilaginibacter humi TaxID=2732510 RepID=A0ABX1W7J5_9SPHI|nr:hypothetical protein [Mucilaginibacter humi]